MPIVDGFKKNDRFALNDGLPIRSKLWSRLNETFYHSLLSTISSYDTTHLRIDVHNKINKKTPEIGRSDTGIIIYL